jgi:hypothetical protein
MKTDKSKFLVGLMFLSFIIAAGVWLYASVREMIWGERLLSWWDPYAFCGNTKPTALPDTVRIGLYEEFPVPWRWDKLSQIDFPVTVALAAPSVTEFEVIRAQVQDAYPVVQEIYYWPLLSKDEGYYPGPFSKAEAIERVTAGSDGLTVLWDWELPIGTPYVTLQNWWQVHTFTDQWLNSRTQPVHIWRSHASMGLDPLFLRLIGMHYDPRDYPNLYFHINLYTVGDGPPPDDVYRILRCGVELYGDRFIPDFGSLNDGEGPAEIFVPVETLRRDLQLAREAGVSEIWLFGVNGLNDDYLNTLKDTIPLETR